MIHHLDRSSETRTAIGRWTFDFSALLATAVILSILVLAGCDNTLGVFSSIAEEKKQAGIDLFNNTIVHAMAEDRSHYFALLAKVVSRPKDKSSGWEVLAVNGSTDYFSPGLASDGTTLYVAKANADNVLEDIYKSTNAGNAGAVWTGLNAAADLDPDTYSVQWLRCANGTLFVAVRKKTDSSYSLFYYNGTNFASAGTAVASLSSPLLDVAWDGSEYWAISTGKVFHGSAGNLAEESAPALADGILGIAADTSRVIISRSDGKLYDNGSGSWSSVEVKTSTALGPLFILKTPAAAQRLLIGKGISTYGYMEMAYESLLNKNTLKENGADYISATASVYLSTAAGKRLVGFWQSDTGDLFMMLAAGGTSSYALYSNTFDPSANNGAGGWSGWTAE